LGGGARSAWAHGEAKTNRLCHCFLIMPFLNVLYVAKDPKKFSEYDYQSYEIEAYRINCKDDRECRVRFSLRT
jgi:hypothetical protein